MIKIEPKDKENEDELFKIYEFHNFMKKSYNKF